MKKLLGALSILAIAGTSGAIAHHSTNLGYDTSIQDFEVSGTFVDFRWINPHVLLRLEVTNDAGEVDTWIAETHSTAVLGRFGWRPNMFEQGQEITIIGNPPRRADDRIIHIQFVETADGKRYSPNTPN